MTESDGSSDSHVDVLTDIRAVDKAGSNDASPATVAARLSANTFGESFVFNCRIKAVRAA